MKFIPDIERRSDFSNEHNLTLGLAEKWTRKYRSNFLRGVGQTLMAVQISVKWSYFL